MLELGKAGAEKGVHPMLCDGSVVAAVATARWREAATAIVGLPTWEYAERGRELFARRTGDPEHAVRRRAAAAAAA